MSTCTPEDTLYAADAEGPKKRRKVLEDLKENCAMQLACISESHAASIVACWPLLVHTFRSQNSASGEHTSPGYDDSSAHNG
jgi:hypothetical protein